MAACAHDPQHPYTKKLIGAAPSKGEIKLVDGAAPLQLEAKGLTKIYGNFPALTSAWRQRIRRTRDNLQREYVAAALSGPAELFVMPSGAIEGPHCCDPVGSRSRATDTYTPLLRQPAARASASEQNQRSPCSGRMTVSS